MAYINFDKAAELFITTRKGDDFQMSLTNVQIDGVNITSSYTASMIVRASEGATALLTWETPNEIVITTGTISFNVAASAMDVTSGVYLYDLKITFPDGAKQTWLYGTFTINPEFS
jgi:hypothetical protein